jgi:hypothetical protein
MSVMHHACTREGNVGWTGGPTDVVSIDGSSRRLPTDANGNFDDASGAQS